MIEAGKKGGPDAPGQAEFREATALLISGMQKAYGVDPNDANFKDTPNRVARAWVEILQGSTNTEEQVDDILSTGFPSAGYDDMIVATGIRTYSVCPHHFLPVEYDITVGYIPSAEGRVLGLSKLVRIADVLSRRATLQETVTKEIADALEKIAPQGIGVHVRGKHMCMRMRGARAHSSVTTTSAMRGCLLKEESARAEFLRLVETK